MKKILYVSLAVLSLFLLASCNFGLDGNDANKDDEEKYLNSLKQN